MVPIDITVLIECYAPPLPAMVLAQVLAGKLCFAGVFACLLLWLILAPAKIFHDAPPSELSTTMTAASSDSSTVDRISPWKNARIWAIGVAAVEMFTYLYFG